MALVALLRPRARERVPAAAIGFGESSSQEPRTVMGICRAGKTSPAVWILRQWVGSSGRCAAFLPARKLGKRYGPGVVARVFERAKVIRIAAKGSEA